MNPEQGSLLVKIARKAIEAKFSLFPFSMDSASKKLFSASHGCFVSVYKDGKLRGRAGAVESVTPLHETLVQAAEGAAFSDPRFPPLEKKEAKQVCIEVIRS